MNTLARWVIAHRWWVLAAWLILAGAGGYAAPKATSALSYDFGLPGQEHVGSTAVPGLVAKPVLDLQAAVADLGCAPAVAEVLAESGWHLVPPELDVRPWRRFLVQVVDDARVAHLHVLAGSSWRSGTRCEATLR